ncbi:Mce-associated membrane protein [Saccharothrix tamanrassetensis]|uniref:Mce-associated membrane protein n=1 Tax=Saccharothrix tamanrassetensis TaxID=1051531 RepID=A0A841C8H1_9PSEU|nr:hypothetical protein [Saccharothrix tamanrassetensis]MBB5954832.1 Mce-associated membrane protein [Saccharothrix tamanrassetensis]
MPPTRRRPVPSTPTVRPRVAGLRKRTDTPTPNHPTPTDTPQQDTPAQDTQVQDTPPQDSQPQDTTPTHAPPDIPDITPTSAPPDIPDAAPTSAPPPFVEDVADTPATTPTPKPRPTGRRKRTGEPVGKSVRTTPEPAPTTPPTSTNVLLPIALVVVAAVLVGLGVWLQGRVGEVEHNDALVDSAGTTEVSGQVREAVEKAFSYNFADVAATEKAADELLVGKAKCQYNAIFGPVRTLAPEQKLVVTVKAVSSGVTSLDPDRATVLLFLDQVTIRTTDNQSGGGIAMMRAGAQKSDGRWKVDNMEMFGKSSDQSAELAKCN